MCFLGDRGYLKLTNYGSETLHMPSYGLREMFEGDFTDTSLEEVLIVSMRGQETLCVDQWQTNIEKKSI